MLGGITPKANKKERAKQLIYELAETNSVVKSEDIVNLAEEKGISKRTLENAKKELGIKGKRIGESWYWKLDEIVKPLIRAQQCRVYRNCRDVNVRLQKLKTLHCCGVGKESV